MTACQPLDAIGGRRKKRGDRDFPTDPVRKHSYDKEDRRAQPWRRVGTGTLPMGKAFVAAMNRTARWLFGEQYRLGHYGPDRLQRTHLLVLEGILSKLDFATGRLDPSWGTIQADGSCGRSSVDRALEALDHAGFLHAVRRTVPIAGAEGQRGPQRKQTSNAFFFDCQRRMTPEVWAHLWSCFREELKKGGKWLLSRARAILGAFNSEATPSPREPKAAQAIRRATRAHPAAPSADRPAPQQTPVVGRPGRPESVPAPAHPRTAEEGLRAILARMASGYGIDPNDVLNAST